jgi:hypothetical protein
MQDFLGFQTGLEAEKLCLQAVHVFDAGPRYAALSLLGPRFIDDLFGVAAEGVLQQLACGLRIAADIAPQPGDGRSLAGDDIGYLRIPRPHADRG